MDMKVFQWLQLLLHLTPTMKKLNSYKKLLQKQNLTFNFTTLFFFAVREKYQKIWSFKKN